MRLNDLKPASGSRPASKRAGRGIGSGLGKTAGRGHKGQKSRSGGFHKVGFEGGQMPLQRRLPKVGFSSRVGNTRAEVRLSEIARLDAETITLEVLIKAGLVPGRTQKAKIIKSGELDKAVVVQGVGVTSGARVVIEQNGGRIED